MQTYWTEPSGVVSVGLRVYEPRTAEAAGCSLGGYYHNAIVPLLAEAPRDEWVELVDGYQRAREEKIAADDQRWPIACACGYTFTSAAIRQLWAEDLYKGSPDGILRTLRDLQPGAMYDAWWLAKYRPGPDGMSLIVVCPDGTPWHVDDRANNCDKKDDHEHRCWCRHGDPRAANITVNKSCNTCGAGGGSIQTGKYHGMLTNGVFTPC